MSVENLCQFIASLAAQSPSSAAEGASSALDGTPSGVETSPSAADALPLAAGTSTSVADPPSLAARLASRQFQSNLTALETRQPEIAAILRAAAAPEVEWLFGRDASLTARTAATPGADPASRWWSGSSLPLFVGRSLMKSLELVGSVGIFLAPGSAGQIRAALEKLSPNQSIIVAIPQTASALIALHCDDFSSEIASGHLWLLCGENWPRQLADLLSTHTGLCIPQQYVRTGLIADSDAAAMMALSNPILSEETSRRTELAKTLQARWSSRPAQRRAAKRLCVVGGSTFALWDIAGPSLSRLLANLPGSLILDKDCPTSASPLALAAAAADCDAILAADLYRTDLPGMIPDQMPWLTWATQPRIAAPHPLAPNDGLILADPAWRAIAKSAGWADHRLTVAGWPALAEPTPIPKIGPLVLIADATLEAFPERLREYSSHTVLWEQIAAELTENPLAAGSDPDAYLSSRIAQLDIESQTINCDLFRKKLILPAWRRGMARLLVRAGLPLVLFGPGWKETKEFLPNWGGAIASFDDLRKVARLAAAIVYPSPAVHAHPVFALGRPVLRPAATFAALARGASTILKAPSTSPATLPPPLTAAAILALLRI